jgi:hypothetical protein
MTTRAAETSFRQSKFFRPKIAANFRRVKLPPGRIPWPRAFIDQVVKTPCFFLGMRMHKPHQN